MTPYTGEMLPDDALDLLAEIVPVIHASRRDRHVEALTLAMDALTWFPLRCAPRDGTYVMLAVAPHVTFNLSGFICIGRWFEPSDDMLEQMGKARRQRYEASGGWWASGRLGRPFGRAVLGWRPVPHFDFDAAGYGPDVVETVGGRA